MKTILVYIVLLVNYRLNYGERVKSTGEWRKGITGVTALRR